MVSEELIDHINNLNRVRVPQDSAYQPPEKGLKWNEGKLDWHSMPLELLEDFVAVFVAGIEKKGYTKFSCLGQFDNPSEFFSGALRHLKACQFNPLALDDDPERGTDCYHAACAAFNCLMYLYHSKKRIKL